MSDLLYEFDFDREYHIPLGVDENGDGPVDEAEAVAFVCFECDEPWPCPDATDAVPWPEDS